MTIMKWKPFKDLESWNPFKEFQLMAEKFSPLFDEMFPFEKNKESSLSDWVPAMDIYESDDAIKISAELPGLDKKDVEITVNNNVLTIKGEKKIDKEIKKENYYRCERSYGTFVRSFTIADYVDPENIKAQFKNGVLEITIPKKEHAKPKEITIE